MKKQELLNRIAKKTGETIKTTQAIFNATFDEIRELLLRGDQFTIERFVGFKTSVCKAHEGRNPLTGEKVTIPAARRVRVIPSISFRKELKNSPNK